VEDRSYHRSEFRKYGARAAHMRVLPKRQAWSGARALMIRPGST